MAEPQAKSSAAPAAVREAAAAFDSANALEEAVSALASAGWDRAQMSVLAQPELLDGAHLPAGYVSASEAEADDDTPREAVVSDTDIRQARTLVASMAGAIAAMTASGIVVLTGGTALAAIAALAAGGGAVATAAAVGAAVGDSHADFQREQIARGGILLWVPVVDADHERRALEILRPLATHVGVHLRRHGGAGARDAAAPPTGGPSRP